MSKQTTTSTKKGITLLGLGTGAPNVLTREAWDWLNTINTLYLRTDKHPVVASLPERLTLLSFDADLEATDVEEFRKAVVEKIIALGHEPAGVTYAVPGHPFIAEATCPEIVKRAKYAGIPVRVIDGLSILVPAIRALALDPLENLVMVDALILSKRHTPGFSPSSPVLITQLSSQKIASGIRSTLGSVYPQNHPVRLIHFTEMGQAVVEDLPLGEIDKSFYQNSVQSLFVPLLSANAAFESFQEVVARLRAPDGCPWDRAQTHRSLRSYLIEEAYEALDALDREDMGELAEELGDLLLQIVLHAQVATENGDFNIHDVIDGISTKLVRRHPHVFSEVEVDDVSGVIHNWETIKAEERKGNGNSEKKGLLDGVPKALPALLQADEIIERVERVKLDHLAKMGTVDSLRKKLEDLSKTEEDQLPGLFGELLLSVVSLMHTLGLEPESVLRESINRFRDRFGKMEASALADGHPLVEFSPAEIEQRWAETNNMEDRNA